MIYLDSAATSMQKPKSVGRAVKKAINGMASAGRGGHMAAGKAADTLFQCRTLAAELFGIRDASNIVLTMNATHGLNIAIKSLCRPGDRVVVSGYEHNSVLRPLRAVGAEIVIIGQALYRPERCLAQLEAELKKGTAALVVMNHVSNVFGYIQPVREAGILCKKYGVPFIVDASQSAGVLPVSLAQTGAAFIAMPGHKGLYGPQGTGLLLCAHEARPLIEGGTGSMSLSQEMPKFLPDGLEAGTHNIAGAAGLNEGLRFILERGTANILKHERTLLREAVRSLKHSDVLVFASENADVQTGVLSVVLPGQDCEIVGASLAERGIAVRAGLHCAPEAHRCAGTLDTGTVRLSFSAFNTAQEVRKACGVLSALK